VFVPGIPGSELFEGDSRIWGADFANAERLRLLDPYTDPNVTAKLLEHYDVLGRQDDSYGSILNLLRDKVDPIAEVDPWGYDWSCLGSGGKVLKASSSGAVVVKHDCARLPAGSGG
jgi:hypothetical protein